MSIHITIRQLRYEIDVDEAEELVRSIQQQLHQEAIQATGYKKSDIIALLEHRYSRRAAAALWNTIIKFHQATEPYEPRFDIRCSLCFQGSHGINERCGKVVGFPSRRPEVYITRDSILAVARFGTFTGSVMSQAGPRMKEMFTSLVQEITATSDVPAT